MIKYLTMTIEFARYLPQQRGALVTNAQANRFPYGSPEQIKLIKIRNAGIDVGDMIANASSAEGPETGRLNSRKKRKPSPQEQADSIAKQMLEAGKTPQEIGAVVAVILGFND